MSDLLRSWPRTFIATIAALMLISFLANSTRSALFGMVTVLAVAGLSKEFVDP